MSAPQRPPQVKLVASIFSGDIGIIGTVVEAMSEKYGQADYISAPLLFSYTDYYEKEFGGSLIRRFVAFERLVEPETLPDVKLWTNALESSFAAGEKRRVNIDPGYLACAHLILATGKGYSHRPYLRDGIYADLTLIYQKGAFQVLPWTYPDYAAGEMIGILTRIREKYLLQLRGGTAENKEQESE
ncbi:MAG: DUF4416 family protein [Syntrophales bacterium]|jgi:hypothetical protein|nr:DUF4416 family protein [Syntrophales bacterium]